MSAISGTTLVQEQDVRIPELSDRSDHAIILHRGTCAGTPELMRKGIMKEESRFMADATLTARCSAATFSRSCLENARQPVASHTAYAL